MKIRQNKINAKIAHTRLYDCDICGFTFRKNELHEQDGLLVCEADYDEEPSYQDRQRNEAT